MGKEQNLGIKKCAKNHVVLAQVNDDALRANIHAPLRASFFSRAILKLIFRRLNSSPRQSNRQASPQFYCFLKQKFFAKR